MGAASAARFTGEAPLINVIFIYMVLFTRYRARIVLAAQAPTKYIR